MNFGLFSQVSVVMTVVDTAGFSKFVGLTVEIVTSVLFILCAGLALDYSAHVGVAYLAAAHSGAAPGRDARASRALNSMGTAIFHGGFSSFLVIALLGTSNSYIFLTFFGVFSMVIFFGLFQGLVFLPVVLSLVGPAGSGGNGGGEDKGSSDKGWWSGVRNFFGW